MPKPKSKIWIDAAGNEVPETYVPISKRKIEKKIRAIHKRFKEARVILEKLVRETLEDIEGIKAIRLGELLVPVAEKGNFQICSFDGSIRISLDQQYNIVMDDRVSVARDLMLNFIKGITTKLGGQDAATILALINEAFKANRSGGLSVSRVLSLLNLEISAPEWEQACDILRDSLSTNRGKQYLNCAERPSPQHDYENIRLDLPSCWPLPQDKTEQE